MIIMIGITIEVIANTTSNPNGVFFAGKFINGFAIGGVITTCMTYVGEVSTVSITHQDTFLIL